MSIITHAKPVFESFQSKSVNPEWRVSRIGCPELGVFFDYCAELPGRHSISLMEDPGSGMAGTRYGAWTQLASFLKIKR